MDTTLLLRNDRMVTSLRNAITNGAFGLSDVPGLVKSVIAQDAWRERVIHETGEIKPFTRFEEFVSMPPLEGLGSDMKTIKRLCGDDPEALDLIDQAVQNPAHIHVHVSDVDNVHVNERPAGNSAARALRKLRQDAPLLHERVLAGELSPHAAMIEAGYRKKSITVPLDPDAAIRRLVAHFSNNDLMHIASALTAIVEERESR